MRWLIRRSAVPKPVDYVVAVGMAVFLSVLLTFLGLHQPGVHRMDVLGYALVIGGSAALILRRYVPVPVLVVTAAVVNLYYGLNYPGGPTILLPAIALATLAAVAGPLRATIVGVSVAVLITVVAAVLRRTQFDLTQILGLAWLLVPVAIGTLVRTRMVAARAAEERAEAETRRRAEEERLHVAREVHDVVAHSLAMINVQAGVAAHVADRRPEQAKEALLAIKVASRTALADLRATLGVLRSGEDRAPAPSLRRMAELVNAATAAGLQVQVHGEPGELPASVDVAAYRILQEALTNAVRHARDASTIEIWFGHTEGGLELVVTDDGAGADVGPAGNGLRGMRERVTALGGSVQAGPRDEGGFAVRVLLPIPGGAR